jgi:hypothetical protein
MSNILGEVFGIAHDDEYKSLIAKMVTQLDNDIMRCLMPTSMAMPQIVYTRDPQEVPIVQPVPMAVDYSISFELEDLEPVEPKRPKRLMVLD